jgi:thiol-disulfide isomerase/thioredoxin
MVSATAQKAIFVGIFVVGVALVYWWSCTCNRKAEGFQDGVDEGAKYSFIMYGVDWCPHCVSAKPEFAALGSTKTIGGAKVACTIVNPEKEPEKVKQKVEGYPTIHLYDAQGKLVKEYSGPRTTAGFEAFLNQTVHG